MITREQARQIATNGRAAGLSDAQITQAIQRANQRSTQVQQPVQQAAQTPSQPARNFAPATPSLTSRLANALDTVQAGGNAFTNAITLGSLDRINAGVDNLLGVDSTVASNRAQRQRLADANPIANALGTVAGVVAPAVLTAGGSTAAQGTAAGTVGAANVANAARGATALRATGTAAAQGAAFDPASDEDTSFLQLGTRARNAAAGGALGGTFNKLGSGLGNLRNRAGELAVRFLKPSKKEVGNINTLFGDSSELGKTLLDSGALKGSLFGGRQKVLENLAELDTAQGAKVGNILSRIVDVAEKADVPKTQTSVNLAAVAKKTKRDLQDSLDLFDIEGSKKTIDDVLDRVLDSVGTNKKGLVEANKIRSLFGKQLFRNKKDVSKLGGAKNQIQETFQRNLKDVVDKKADTLATKIVGAEKVFTGAKKTSSQFKKARQVLKDRVEADISNNRLSLSQRGALGLGGLEVGRQALSGDVEGAAKAGIGTAAVTALLNPRSTATQARLLNQIGQRTQGLGNLLQNNNTTDAVSRLLQLGIN
jgi:hypothetical protein